MRRRCEGIAMHKKNGVVFAFGLLASIVGGLLPASAADKVVMGWLPATDALPYFVALEEKAFEKAGIEVELKQIPASVLLKSP